MENNRATILLVEDNAAILEANRRVFAKVGYEVLSAETLAAARAHLQKGPPDAIVLDIMLPDGNGLDFIEEIRQRCTAPVLLLTSLDERDERLAGLRAGGDDYITKPYDVMELRERVAAFLRREVMLRERLRERMLTRGLLTLNAETSQAFVSGEDLLLTPKEFSLLLLLAQNEGSIMQAGDLYERAWNRPMLGDANAVRVAVSRLRKKLSGTDYTIAALRGEGYRFEKQ